MPSQEQEPDGPSPTFTLPVEVGEVGLEAWGVIRALVDMLKEKGILNEEEIPALESAALHYRDVVAQTLNDRQQAKP
jgi:hypothetical protein